MVVAITQTDLTVKDLCGAASRTSDGDAARRILAITLILEGADRKSAGETCGGLPTLRDWVHRYNEKGLDDRHNRQDLRRVGVNLGLVDRHRTELQEPGLLRPQKDLDLLERGLEGCPVRSPESGDCIMIGVAVRSHQTHTKIPIGRPFQATRGEKSVRRAVNQTPQHHPGMIARLANGPMADLESIQAHPVQSRDHEMGQIVLRDPIVQTGRQQEQPI